MNLREKMKMCGVSRMAVNKAIPEANYPQVCNSLNEEMVKRIQRTATQMCQEKAEAIKKQLQQI